MEYFKKNAQEKNKKKQNRQSEDEEETMTYLERKRPAFLNENSSVFQGLGEDSFHLAPSVFDRQAIFHTGGQKKD